jgi:hypothetical protein
LGNGAYSSFGHIPVNDRVSLLFIDFANGGRLHVNRRRVELVAALDEHRSSPKRMEDKDRPPALAELVLAHLTASFPADGVSANQRPD